MKLSIIIPVYNSQKYLNECLNSVCKQVKKDVELILINDCSTDKSSKICKKFVNKYKFLKLINISKNKGAAFCRNLGIKNSKGKYICFLDSDDKLTKGSVKIILHYIKKFSEKEIFALKAIDRNRKVTDESQFIGSNPDDKKINIIDLIKDNSLFRATCWNFIVQKRFLYLNKIKFKNTRVLEDQIFVSHLLCVVKKYKIIPKPIYIRRTVNVNSLLNTKGYVRVNSCMKAFYEISQITHLTKKSIDKKKIKFLISRINFVCIEFLLNILLCGKSEINIVSKYLFKHFSIISKFPSNYIKKYIFFLNKKNLIKKKLLEHKAKKIKFLKNLCNKIKDYKTIIVCAGMYGSVGLQILTKLGVKVDFIIDNNINYKDQKLDKIIIKNPKFLKKNLYKFSRHKFLICNKNKIEFNKISNQLKSIGLKRRNIIHAEL